MPGAERFRRRLLCAALALAAGLSARALPSAAQEVRRPVTVYAAASLTQVLAELSAHYPIKSPGIRFSFAGSSQLARQLEAGGEADLFVSADEAWMDWALKRRLVRADTRRALLSNRLVFVAAREHPEPLSLARGVALRARLGTGRLAIAEPDAVPAGRYAEAALKSLGLWAEVEDRLVRAENVRQALSYVARGDAPLGIVYETDARAEPRVAIVARVPAETHPPIRYWVAATPRASRDALGFLAFLEGPEAKPIFEGLGFEVLSSPVPR